MVMYSELPTGQRLYLDNQGIQTIVTLASGASGQQQQSSSSFTTGVWTKEPEIQITPQGVIINIITATGNHSVHIQGASISLSSPNAFAVSQSSQSSIVSPASMTPMTPMKMGNMSMSFSPMEMQIGDMKMSMGEAKTASKRQFCSQCGAKVSESDRFCSSCGVALN